ncbi:hypothetical protein [Demequina lutea]|uniref:Uncharacterized protein n=1 Tax=Demequina lutea TaxID=431489 RepID=A0A7Z0CKE1_9MICO|nr:hypothetical protein [Demequina lutea]NYI41803.1 hypothetical protein [Demequina lutea]
MTVTDMSSPAASATGLPRGVRLAIALTLGLVAPILTALVILGGVTAATVSGATVIRGANGGSVLEWAAPLSVWQWEIAGVIEFALIAAAAIAWWSALTVWRGQFVPDYRALSARRFAAGAGSTMVAATVLALVVHIRNWSAWHTLIAQHPEWHESAQSWQIPVGGAVALLIVAEVVAGYGFLRRRTRGL